MLLAQVTWGCFSKTIGILLVFLLVPICAALGNIGFYRAQSKW